MRPMTKFVASTAFRGKHELPRNSHFIDALRSLSENPQRCALAPENDLLVFEARQLHYGLGAKPTHRAVFVVRPNQVLVLRIRHLAQQNIIPDDFV